MIILQCNVCGGEIELSPDGTMGQCKFCRNKFYFKNPKNDYLINEINKANEFLRKSDFDNASVLFNAIEKSYPEDAEVLWGSLMSKYGIVDVIDDRTGNIIPTCSRLVKESIFNDPLYIKALENAAPEQKAEYERRAKIIDRLEKKIYRDYQQEEDYDVFISFKARGPKGELTEDAVVARNIYDELTARGIKTFFSEVSLQGRIGEDFEPIIFRALYSCKFFILVATSEENLNAVWVKNEWTRFRDRAKAENLNKCACAVFRSDAISLHAFNPIFRSGQGIDLAKFPAGGYEKLLADSLCRTLGKTPSAIDNYEEKIRQVNEQTQKLLERAEQATKSTQKNVSSNTLYTNIKSAGIKFFRNGMYQDAKAKFSEALNYDSNDEELIFLSSLCDALLNESTIPIKASYRNIVEQLSKLSKRRLSDEESTSTVTLYTQSFFITAAAYIDTIVRMDQKIPNLLQQIAPALYGCYAVFNEILSFPQANQPDTNLNHYINQVLTLLIDQQEIVTNEAQHYNIGAFPSGKYKFNSINDLFSLLKLEMQYQDGLKYYYNEDYLQAAKVFDELGDYKKSAGYYETSMIKAIPQRYEIAVDNYNNGDLDNAEKEFREFSNYLDSKNYLLDIEEKKRSTIYDTAEELYQKEYYNSALNEYKKLSNYKDSEEKIKACQEAIAEIDAQTFKSQQRTALRAFIVGIILTCGLVGFYIYGIADLRSFYVDINYGLPLGMIFISIVVFAILFCFAIGPDSKKHFEFFIFIFFLICLALNLTVLILPSTKTITLTEASDYTAFKNCPYGNYILESDLNLENSRLKRIEIFTGSIDGNGYAIENLDLSEKSWIKRNKGEIQNITFRDCVFDVNLIQNNRRNIAGLVLDNVTINSPLFDKNKDATSIAVTMRNCEVNDVALANIDNISSLDIEKCKINKLLADTTSISIKDLMISDSELFSMLFNSCYDLENITVKNSIFYDAFTPECTNIKNLSVIDSVLNKEFITECNGSVEGITVKNTTMNYNSNGVEAMGFIGSVSNCNLFQDVYFENVQINVGAEADIRYLGSVVGDFGSANYVYNVGIKNISIVCDPAFKADVLGGMFGHIFISKDDRVFDSCFAEDVILKVYATKTGSGYIPSIGGMIGGVSHANFLHAGKLTNCYVGDLQIYGNFNAIDSVSLMIGSVPNNYFTIEHCYSTIAVDEGNYAEDNTLRGMVGRFGNGTIYLDYSYSDIYFLAPNAQYNGENNYLASTASITDSSIMDLLELDTAKWTMTENGPALIWAQDK